MKSDYPQTMAFPILSAEERRRTLVEWNATEAEYPKDKCIHQLFEEQVERNSEAVAVVYEDQSLSYGELNARANRLAHHLRDLEVKPDTPVAICVERSLEMVVGLLAILKAGGCYVPLDPEYPAERLAFMLKDANPSVVLTHRSAREKLQEALAQVGEGVAPCSPPDQVLARSDKEQSVRLLDGSDVVPSLHGSVFAAPSVAILDLEADLGDWATYPASNPDPKAIGLTPRHLAYIIYTSGSTGQPKGVMIEHSSLINRLFWMQKTYIIGYIDAVLQKTPFSFDVSVWEFFWTLMAGAKLVLARPGGHKDTQYLNEVIKRHHISVIHFVPSMLRTFLAAGKDVESSPLKNVFCSGEELSRKLVSEFHDIFNGAELHNLYGPTEATIDVTAWVASEYVGSSSPPIGRPISNTRIYLLDGTGNPVPLGVSGEIYIGGAGVARGYLNRAELTSERFIASPFVAGDRLYKTGDLGRYLADGNIEFLGRNDFQVKIRGFRIELGEIEAKLVSHPLVREAVVLAREDEPGNKRLVAYYTMSPKRAEGVSAHAAQGSKDAEASGDVLGAETLHVYLSEALPEYMVPTAYVPLDVLPLTLNGKLDRKALTAPPEDTHVRRTYEAPVGAIETAIAEIWSEVLGIKRVGRHDDFFELGGHSLPAMRITARVRERFDILVSMAQVFTEPTIKLYATILQEAHFRGDNALG